MTTVLVLGPGNEDPMHTAVVLPIAFVAGSSPKGVRLPFTDDLPTIDTLYSHFWTNSLHRVQPVFSPEHRTWSR